MDRIDMSKKLTLRPHTPEGRFVGRLRKMLVYIEGDIGEDVVLIVVYRDLDSRLNRKSFKKLQPIAELSLSKEYCDGAYHVDLMRIDYRYQGNGIGPMLYRYILRKFPIMLQAGTMQSLGGRKIWAALAKMPDISVFAAYRRGKQAFEIDLDDEDEELRHDDIQLYDSQRKVYTFAMAV